MAKTIKKTQRPQTKNGHTTNINNWLIGGGIAIVILALGYLLYSNLRGPSPIPDLIKYFGEERGHNNDAIYTGELPPVGGLHSEVWQNCGIYDEVIDSKNAVHSLEHGAVWITYPTNTSQKDIDTLQNLVRGETHLLLSPFSGQESPVIMTAWEAQLELNSVQDKRFQTFIDRYRQGSTTPERGATCQDGVGEPLP